MLIDGVTAEVRQELVDADVESQKTRGRSMPARLKVVRAVAPVFFEYLRDKALSDQDRERLSLAYESRATAGADGYRRVAKIVDAVVDTNVLAFFAGLVGATWAFWDTGNLGRLVLAGFLVVCLAGDVAVNVRSLARNWSPSRNYLAGVAARVVLVDGMVLFLLALLLAGVPSVDWGGRTHELSGGWTVLAVAGACAVISAWFAALVVVLNLVERLLTGLARSADPESFAFFAAALVFSQLIDRTPGERGLPSVGSIKTAARHLYRVRRTRRFTDHVSRAVVEDRFAQAAAAVRETGLWVALPNAETRSALRAFYADLMLTILERDYDDLPTASPNPAITPRARSRAVLRVLRTVAVGAGPVLILWAVQSLHGPIPAPLGPTLTAFVAVWAVIVFIGLVDPALRERFEVAKSVAGIFTGK